MTPQELMDMDGAGSARKQLIKDGIWDETGQGEYVVNVYGTKVINVSEAIEVSASSPNDAKKKARRLSVIDDIDGVEVMAYTQEETT